MSCSNPRKGFILGIKENGKKDIRICSFNTAWVYDRTHTKKIYDYVLVPCGNCLQCRLNYAKQWSYRCMLEASFYESNYFLTLTYDDENRPKNLLKEDLQRFIASLRKSLKRSGKPDIRFFACGEYGSHSLREHFHVLVFNLKLDDLLFLKRSKQGYNLYSSNTLDKIWHKGFVQVGDVSLRSCGYVARYCLKGVSHTKIEDLGLNKEFILMSRRPGIGYGFFDKNKEFIYDTDKIYFDFGDNLFKINPPAYFDYLLQKLDPDLLEQIKDKRRLKADFVFANEFINSSLVDELEYLKLKDSVIEEKIKILKERDNFS